MSCQFSCSLKKESYECVIPHDGPCAETPGQISDEKESFTPHQSVRSVQTQEPRSDDSNKKYLYGGIVGFIIFVIVLYALKRL
jgi:hypothetical protein